MPSHEERLAVLETTVNEHTQTFGEVRDSMNRLDQRMDRLELRMDARFDRLEERFVRIDGRFDRVDEKVSRLFTWVVGIQITVLLAVIGSLLGLVAILAPR